MRTAQKLALKKETLTELTSGEMQDVVGGTVSDVVRCNILSNVITPCPTRGLTDPICDRVSVMIHPCPSRDVC